MSEKNDPATPTITLSEVRDTLRQLGADVNKNHYHIGKYYNLVVDKKMASMGGYKSAQDFFSKEVKEISQSVLSTCGTVARAFEEQAGARHSVYHLYFLLAYGKAAGLTLSKTEPGPTPIDVPMEDGTIVQKSFSDCTVEDLKEAAKHKRAKAQPSLPEEVLARIQAVRDHLTANFPEDDTPTRLTSRLIDKDTYVTFKDVRFDDLILLLETLMSSLDDLKRAA